MHEPMTWPGEFGNFVISEQPMQEIRFLRTMQLGPEHNAWEDIMRLHLTIGVMAAVAIASTATYAQNAVFGTPGTDQHFADRRE